MHVIGSCLLNMNKLMKAKEYLQKVLQIKAQISLDVDIDENVHVIGSCLLDMNKLMEAKEYLE